MSCNLMPRKMPSSEISKPTTILPPTKKKLVVKNKLKLLLEFLWLFFIAFPAGILLNVFRKIYPHPGKSLKGQVAIVTGAGRGLGRGLALELAREGAKVAVVDIDSSSASETAQAIVDTGGVAKSYTTNIGSIEEIHQLRLSVAKDLGPVDILVNNAGLILIESIDDMSEAEVRSVMEINLLSHFWMAREFLPEMKSRNSGHIVAICSMSALVSIGRGTAYTSSKCGLMGFMEALRIELNFNPMNKIKTTTVLPYFINTSEHYVNQWDVRLPPLSIKQVAETTITAVKKDKVILSVPETMYFGSILLKLLPTELQDKIYSVIHFRMTSPTKEDKALYPVQRLVNEFIKKRKD